MWLKKFSILSLIVLLAVIVACQSPPTNKIQEELRIGLESNPTNLDPRLATDAASARVTQVVFNALVRKDLHSKLVPEIAAKWEMPDNTTYVFYLHKGISFHDGKELTAHDVEYTFKSILDENSKSPRRSSYEQIKQMEVVDDYTIKFILKEPFAPFLLNMTMGIVPRHLAGKEDFSRHPVGSGPFEFIEWRPDEKVVFERFSGYFEGLPYLERLVYKIIPEDTTRLLALKKGDIDLVQNAVPPDMLADLEADPNLKVVKSPGTTYAYMGFNMRDKILGNKLVRKAIAHGINRRDIINHILNGLATPANSLLSSDNWAYNSDLPDYVYDPARARKLLDEAGYTDPDGKGPEFRFNLVYKTSQNELSRRIAEVLQAQLTMIGIGVDIKSYEWGSFYADITSGNFQIYSLKWVGVTDPDIYYYIFHSQSIPAQGANRGYFVDEKLDTLLEAGRTTLDENKRAQIYRQVQQIIAEELPYVSLWHSMNVVVMGKYVEGFVLYPAGDFTSLKNTMIKR